MWIDYAFLNLFVCHFFYVANLVPRVGMPAPTLFDEKGEGQKACANMRPGSYSLTRFSLTEGIERLSNWINDLTLLRRDLFKEKTTFEPNCEVAKTSAAKFTSLKTWSRETSSSESKDCIRRRTLQRGHHARAPDETINTNDFESTSTWNPR